jgi:hypothetical protein
MTPEIAEETVYRNLFNVLSNQPETVSIATFEEFKNDPRWILDKRFIIPAMIEMYELGKSPLQPKEAEPTGVERMSEIGIWLQSQLRFFTSTAGEIVKVSDYAGGLSIKFKSGNGYTLKLSKQCQVTLD